MMDRKISVVVLIYKVAPYVEQCVASVVAQTYKNLEIILVVGVDEDGPDDGCLAICQKYAQMDPRIKIVEHPPVGGISASRNLGLAAATGDLLGYVDGDDYIEPDMFEKLEAHMRKENAQVAICGRFYEFQNVTLQDDVRPVEVMTGEEALCAVFRGGSFFLHCWDKLSVRSMWEGMEFPIGRKCEDRIIVDQILGKADRVVYDRTPKYHFRERSGSMSKKSDSNWQNVLANQELTAYVEENHPAAANDCYKFMIYEHITAIQNLWLAESVNKEELKQYKEILTDISKKVTGVSIKLRLKMFLALHMTSLLGLFTRIRKQKTDESKVRFQ